MLLGPGREAGGQLQGALEHTSKMSPFPSQLELPLGGGGTKNWAPAKAGLHQDALGFQDLHTGHSAQVPDLGPVLCLCHFIASDLSSVSPRGVWVGRGESISGFMPSKSGPWFCGNRHLKFGASPLHPGP